jgi:hypothetical protein
MGASRCNVAGMKARPMPCTGTVTSTHLSLTTGLALSRVVSFIHLMAQFNADFRIEEARSALTQFAQLVGYADMMRALEKVEGEINRRRALSIGLLNRYRIPRGLLSAYRYVRSTGRAKSPVRDPYSFAACTFANAAVSVSRCLTGAARDRLAGMVWQGLGLDGDARRLQHEFTVAAHFAKNGWDVEFIDMERRGLFDYLVRKGALEADVECKTISADKGNAIHMKDVLAFMDAVCDPMLEVFDDGWWTVDMTFDIGLPKDRPQQIALSRELARCMMEGQAVHAFRGGSAALSFKPMPRFSGKAELEDFANGVMCDLQDRLNGHAEVICSSRRMLAIGASSARPSRVLEYSYEDIKQGCLQLSGARAGCVWTHFMDITDGEMRMLAESPQETALEAFTTRIYRDEGRGYVTSLAFTGEGTVRKLVRRKERTIDTSYSQQGIMRSYRNVKARFPLPENEFPGLHRLD